MDCCVSRNCGLRIREANEASGGGRLSEGGWQELAAGLRLAMWLEVSNNDLLIPTQTSLTAS